MFNGYLRCDRYIAGHSYRFIRVVVAYSFLLCLGGGGLFLFLLPETLLCSLQVVF